MNAEMKTAPDQVRMTDSVAIVTHSGFKLLNPLSDTDHRTQCFPAEYCTVGMVIVIHFKF